MIQQIEASLRALPFAYTDINISCSEVLDHPVYYPRLFTVTIGFQDPVTLDVLSKVTKVIGLEFGKSLIPIIEMSDRTLVISNLEDPLISMV